MSEISVPPVIHGHPRYITKSEYDTSEEGQGGGGGGSFLSHEIARVDPNGDDATGVIGDLLKPFLTVQAAIAAFEAGSFTFPVIDIGNNDCNEDLTTSLGQLGIISVAGSDAHFAFHSLTATGGGLNLSLSHCYSNGDGSLTANGNVTLYLHDAGLDGPVITTSGSVFIQAQVGFYGTYGGYITDVTSHANIQIYGIACQGTLTSETAGDIAITDSPWLTQYCIIDSPGSDVVLRRALIYRILAGGANNVTLTDSRITFSNGASGTTTYADQLLAKIVFPDADPHVAGAGYWVDGVLTKSAG
jgi:hypothetical protein